MLPNQIPLTAVVTKKIPATMPVAGTDLVSRNTQNVTANQVVKFDDRNEQRVDQQVHKGAIGAPAEVEHARLGRRHLADSRS
jgi:hypothetical protein